MLIADRDYNERIGIRWLLCKYGMQQDDITLTDNVSELMELISVQRPGVLCIELDMIPVSSWDELQQTVEKNKPIVIAMTAEPTFERALQAIRLHSRDIWIKPLQPESVKYLSTWHYRESEPYGQQTVLSADTRPLTGSYESLFLDERISRNRLMLVESEHSVVDRMKLANFLDDYFLHDPPALLPLDDHILCVFRETAPYSPEDILYHGKKILAQWSRENTLCGPLFIVVYESDGCGDLHSLYQQYVNAKEALTLRFYLGYKQIITINNKVEWAALDPFLTPLEQRAWVEMLNEGDRAQLKEWMHKEFLGKREYYPYPTLLRTRLVSILAQIRRFMKSMFLDKDKVVEELYNQAFETIHYNPILYRIVQQLLLFIYELLDQAERHRQTGRIDVTEYAIRYIEKNFSQPDLRLHDVAQYVNRNPSYLSSLLAKQPDNSFRMLLTDARIREAQRLLANTDLSVKEIAAKTGFSSPNYLVKVFKARVKMTPSGFRNQIKCKYRK